MGASAPASAAAVFYNINFTANPGRLAPTSGSFTYDADNPAFSSFFIFWNGINFDLTAAANAPVMLTSVCDTPEPAAADVFALFDGTSACAPPLWTAEKPLQGSGNDTSFLIQADPSALGALRIEANGGPSDSQVWELSNFSNGSFTITTAPEPSTLALLLGGGLLFEWRRRRTAKAMKRQTTIS
jgi:hypothetical protein